MALPQSERDRLVLILNMIGSAHVGERAAAAVLAAELVHRAGETWDSVLAPAAWVPPPEPLPDPAIERAAAVARARERRWTDSLTDAEVAFVLDLAEMDNPTASDLATHAAIMRKVKAGAG